MKGPKNTQRLTDSYTDLQELKRVLYSVLWLTTVKKYILNTVKERHMIAYRRNELRISSGSVSVESQTKD
jgi:hypothetical protein